jgi:hypothetical protein
MSNTLVHCSLALAIVACAAAKPDSTSSLAPTKLAPPANLKDTILQVAIRDAIGHDSSATPRRVLLQPPPGVNPRRILPPLRGTTFVTLSSTEFQKLADRTSTITRLVVGTPRLYGDSATVEIWMDSVTPRDSAIVSGGGGCTYVLTRSTNGWRVEKRVTCIFLD